MLRLFYSTTDRAEFSELTAEIFALTGALDQIVSAQETRQSIAQLMAWIHPFFDGNGRISRLYSHACLIRAGADGGGLWSLSRGLARSREDYYRYLSRADQSEPYEQHRRLSEAGLGDFTRFFLESLLDQIRFMLELLELQQITERMERYVRFQLRPAKHEEALAKLLRWTFIERSFPRGKVKEITGLKDTAAREVINLAFEDRLIQSPTPKGAISLAFPARVLDFYFPRLYV